MDTILARHIILAMGSTLSKAARQMPSLTKTHHQTPVTVTVTVRVEVVTLAITVTTVTEIEVIPGTAVSRVRKTGIIVACVD
jgi:hypothetical protein